ncbi:hypothetical protein GH714_033592 [Hevea brasiliensis]|uniref:Disease resistance RPP13-like protein 1 n=1 Tax=Hevea brasiliensis TaxID=3981 RepID=A0A6A6NAA5_HEVBR|nr:hypothetical protein GH714_033592 [Hevea brasiliensis]
MAGAVGKKLNSELLKRLEITLLSVNVVLDDAEEKQIRNKNVKKWLEELKDAVYDAEDLLDEISTESLRCKVEAESQSSITQVQNFCSSFNPFNKGVNSKLEEVLARLEFIAKQKDVLGLKEGFAEKPLRRLEETSVVDESSVYGRDAEKESIMKLLLSDETSGYDDIGVVTIVGMGGIGKTTLAQLVYNDYRLKEYFSYQAWVCVSEEFDIFRVLKTILEQVTSSATGT